MPLFYQSGILHLVDSFSFLACEVISKAQQISVAFFQYRFDSRSNNSSSLPETLRTILSVIVHSFSLKLHAAAQGHISVRNTSIIAYTPITLFISLIYNYDINHYP